MRNRLTTGAAALGLLILLAGGALAVPQTINYQGFLSEDGVPVDGTRSVRFRIYDSSEGGNYLWEDTYSVAFTDGVFSVTLGSTQAIPDTVFSGARRWLSIAIDGGAEILPRGELVSVGYAFRSASAAEAETADSAEVSGQTEYADLAGNASLLDGYDSSQFAGATHSHDSRYYSQSLLNTSDGTPPNQGSNLVHWNILTGMPSGFSDGVDNVGEGGATDHGELTGLLDDEHTQYAQKDTLKTSDGSPPNQGPGQVHWNVLTGMPSDFADGVDNITTDASSITSGEMAPERIEGTAVVDSDSRLLSVAQKNALTGGGATTLHSHTETGDISSVTAGEGLDGGGTEDDVSLSHAEDASGLAFAHHYPPIIAYHETTTFESDATEDEVVISVAIDAPADGFLYISFSGSQYLDLDLEGFPPNWEAKRYIARYGVAVDTTDMDYFVTSSMQDTTFWAGGTYVPAKAIAGSTMRSVTAGSHTVYLLTKIVLEIDSEAGNIFKKPSLTVVYYPFDNAGFAQAAAHRTPPPEPRTATDPDR
jgi:hypothetical protein